MRIMSTQISHRKGLLETGLINLSLHHSLHLAVLKSKAAIIKILKTSFVISFMTNKKYRAKRMGRDKKKVISDHLYNKKDKHIMLILIHSI